MAHIGLDFFSAQVSKTVHAEIILPMEQVNYQAEAPYKTVYWLPGFSNNARDIMAMCHFRESSQQMNYALVIIDADNSFFVDRPMANYSRLVGEELVTVTRELFPLSKQREDTILAGNSMGGYGTLYNGLRYPNTFGKLVVLCPGLDFYQIVNTETGENMFQRTFLDEIFGSENNYATTALNPIKALKDACAAGANLPEIFYGIGRQDNVVGASNVQLREAFERLHVPVQQVFVEGGHDMVFLENILPYVNEYLAQ